MSDLLAPRTTMPAVLAHPFRAFFIACGLYAIVLVMAWVAFFFGGWPLPIGWSPLQWHSHEMLYGFVSAAIAGFLLTAMTNWTGAKPLQGGGLLALLMLWLAGRVVMGFASWLSAWFVAVVDLAFLPVLALYAARILLRYNNRRNLVLVAVLGLLFLGNLSMHLGFVTGRSDWLHAGQLHGFNMITALIVIIAGRIVPAFTGNWLRNNGGNPAWVRSWKPVEILVLPSVILLMIADWLPLPVVVVASLALLAGALNAIRLFGWAGWRTAREPLLWILHLSYLWVAIALLLRGSSVFIDGISPTLWQHALGIGGIASLILGVMTRVAMGHTGRPLGLRPYALWIYIAIIAATLLRITAAVGITDYRVSVILSAVFWVLAFGLFVVLYTQVLASPRADGQPG